MTGIYLYRSHDNALGRNSWDTFHDMVVTLETNRVYALNFYGRPNYLTLFFNLVSVSCVLPVCMLYIMCTYMWYQQWSEEEIRSHGTRITGEL